MSSDPLFVVAKLARLFDDLNIPYVVGGSLASSLYGIPRATLDADLVADIAFSHVEPITQALTSEFYVDDRMIRDAVQRRASFNVIHLATMFKVDLFIPVKDAWFREELSRARTERLEAAGDHAIRFASPEDTVLHKLVWYKQGNQVSDRQWTDLLGVLKIQGPLLDWAYLEQWAHFLDVADLLARAKSQS